MNRPECKHTAVAVGANTIHDAHYLRKGSLACCVRISRRNLVSTLHRLRVRPVFPRRNYNSGKCLRASDASGQGPTGRRSLVSNARCRPHARCISRRCRTRLFAIAETKKAQFEHPSRRDYWIGQTCAQRITMLRTPTIQKHTQDILRRGPGQSASCPVHSASDRRCHNSRLFPPWVTIPNVVCM